MAVHRVTNEMIYRSIKLEDISLFQDVWMQTISRNLLYYNNFSIMLCPVEKTLFHSIPFHFIYFIYAASIVRNGWVHFPVEQTGRPHRLSLT